MDSSSPSADILPQTLCPSFSSSSSDQHPQSPSPPISKTSSFTKLNAQAPEFVPRTSSSASLASSSPSSPLSPSPLSSSSLSSSSSACNLVSPTQQQSDLPASFVIPRPPGPPALVHVHNTTQLPSLQGHYAYGYGSSPLQFYGGLGGALDRQHDLSVLATSALTHTTVLPPAAQVNSDGASAATPLKNGLPEDAAQKLMKQVEFYFSDVNLATTGYLFKVMCKDPEGYVPISVVASIKKIKTLTKNQSQLASVLQGSSKLVVSDDGKKVKRRNPLNETDMEEVQSRIIIAENLPEDHSHQNLVKIFSAVGSVKSIRSCQPGGPSSASKADSVNFSNKLHAFVEYESSELAEKAVAELNEDNWRNGLKVRLLLKRSTKFGQGRVKRGGHEAELNCKEEDAFAPEHQEINELEDSVHLANEPTGEEHTHDEDGGGPRKGRSREAGESRNWGKGRGRQSQNVNSRGNHAGATSDNAGNVEQSAVGKQPSVPRMPDGTKGFSMGRGKPVAVRIA